jgi:hypothetical protein
MKSLNLLRTNPDGEIWTDILTSPTFNTFLGINLLNNIGAFGITPVRYLQYLFRAGGDTDTAALANFFLYTNRHITLQSVEEFLLSHEK